MNAKFLLQQKAIQNFQITNYARIRQSGRSDIITHHPESTLNSGECELNLFRLLLLVILLHCEHSSADTLQGKVIGIGDGDTVTVLDSRNQQWKVRLMGIDAPEKKQAFGTKSKESLSGLIYGKQVSVEYHKRDRYGRTIGKIMVDGIDANLEQVKAGLAWHYKKYANEQSAEDRSTYSNAEEQAKATKKGLWTDPSPVPPWEWRHQPKAKR